MIVSPCISICKTDYNTGYCYGCARTNKEKIIWKDERTSNQWKKENINEIIKKMISFVNAKGTKNFNYNYNIEINNDLTPETWKKKLI